MHQSRRLRNDERTSVTKQYLYSLCQIIYRNYFLYVSYKYYLYFCNINLAYPLKRVINRIIILLYIINLVST